MSSIPNEERALILQGGGALGAYEVGAYRAAYQFLKHRDNEKGNASRPIFDIIAGTSIGAINAAILVSYVMENKTWEGSAERLIEFWDYISADSFVDRIANYWMKWWDYWTQFYRNIATAEGARRYYSTKEFAFIGVPSVFSPPHTEPDKKFFDPTNAWYRYDNHPIKKSLERFAKFPIATNHEDNQPRLILTAVDVAAGEAVVFDSYPKSDGSRTTGYGNYVGDEDAGSDGSGKSGNAKETRFERIIRYDEGITADQVVASAAVPVSYDYVQLEVESYDDQIKNYKKEMRYFWDGGLLSNTPLAQVIVAHRRYWYFVRRVKDAVPKLGILLINLHPARVDTVPWDYDGVRRRNADIIFADRSKRDETIGLIFSDYIELVKNLIKLAKDHGVKEKVIDELLDKRLSSHGRLYGVIAQKYREIVEGQFNIGEIIRIERKHDVHAVSGRILDFSSNTINRLLKEGYDDVIDYINTHLGTEHVEAAGMQYDKASISARQIRERQE